MQDKSHRYPSSLHPGETRSLPCVLRVPDYYRSKARYALRMLLYPFGLEPEWRAPEGSPRPDDDGRAVLFYGSGRPPVDSWVQIPMGPSTPRFFREKRPYGARPPEWLFDEEAKVPVLFPRREEMISPGTGGERGRRKRCAWDYVASTFFWLSRWQEHTRRTRDRHGRPPFETSLQARWEIGAYPPVEVYRRRLARALEAAGVRTRRRTWDGRDWALAVTHDVDYGRKWRPGIVVRELLGRPAPAGSRHAESSWAARALGAMGQLLRGRDAYRRSLRRILREERSRDLEATYFLKAGAHGPRDVGYSLEDGFVEEFLGKLREAGMEVGLHPGYHSFDHPERYRAERARLRAAYGRSSRSVRHHYLRRHDPVSTRIQETLGLTVDATVGWADRSGFRAGTCLPYLYFDPVADAPRRVWQVPLAVMDTTLFRRRSLSPGEARVRTEELMRIARRFGGIFCGLWHEMIYDVDECPGWGEHFEHALETARERGAAIRTLSDLMEGYLR